VTASKVDAMIKLGVVCNDLGYKSRELKSGDKWADSSSDGLHSDSPV